VTIAEEGGITTIISAMKNCPKNPDVQDYGCGALSNLAVNNDNNHSTIAKEGGVETIRSAMASHSNNARVQNHG
jgi:hypothetical protein